MPFRHGVAFTIEPDLVNRVNPVRLTSILKWDIDFASDLA